MELDGQIIQDFIINTNLCKLNKTSDTDIILKLIMNKILKSLKKPVKCPFKNGTEYSVTNLRISTKSLPVMFMNNYIVTVFTQYKAKFTNLKKFVQIIKSKIVVKMN